MAHANHHNEPRLGRLITPEAWPHARRDAIHIAVIPLIAGEHLWAGAYFKLKYGTQDVAMQARHEDAPGVLGIIDPFLRGLNYGEVKEGDRVWGYLTPGTVTGMRHAWQHPAFTDDDVPYVPPQMNEHEAWLRDFADRWHFNYEDMVEEARHAPRDNNDWSHYVVAQGKDLHGREELGHDYYLFWQHMEGLTGERYDDVHRESLGWSCSC